VLLFIILCHVSWLMLHNFCFREEVAGIVERFNIALQVQYLGLMSSGGFRSPYVDFAAGGKWR
jgi:hypothetical protein